VKSGDSLTKIAKAHGTTVKAIKAENNLNTDHLKVGQKLKIPAKAEAAAPVAPMPAPAPAGTPSGQ
jgi:LysM repeat protein